jgi:23S rRNA (uracil1939-C5)-methyltransferase
VTDSARVDRLVPGGDGFLRGADGKATFVPGGFPGDVIRIRRADEKKSHRRVLQFELLEPSPERRAAPCPLVDRCGGCDWMALEEPAQRRHKGALVVEAMRRTGGRDIAPPPIVAHEPSLGYRRRIRLHAAGGRLGFHARASNELVPVRACPAARPALDEALGRLTAKPIPEAVDQIELRAGDDGPAVLADVRLHPGPTPDRWLHGLATDLAVYARHRRWDLFGPQSIAVAGGLVPSPAGSFTQVHGPGNDALVTAVVDGLVERGARRVLELYAGAGNFTLELGRRGIEVLAIEGRGPAVDAGRRAADGLPIRFDVGDAVTLARNLRQRGERFDAVLLDPPRAGARGLAELLPDLAPAVAWVACDPVALARDLKAVAPLELRSLTLHDLFPQTHHVECLAWLGEPRGVPGPLEAG